MIIIPNIAGKKDPVAFGGGSAAYAGYSAGTITTGAPLGATILYASGSYQTNTSLSISYGGQPLPSLGTGSGYGNYRFNGIANASVTGSITATGSYGSGYGHAAAWFTGASSIEALTPVRTAESLFGYGDYSYSFSCLEGEMLVVLTAIPVGVGTFSGGTGFKADYYTHSNYGGAGIRYAAGPATVTFTTSSGWGYGQLVLCLKP